MKKITLFLILLFLALPYPSRAFHLRQGNILLQVEENGEAWYVYPPTGQRHFLGRPADAFSIMRKLGLGATHEFITNNEIFPDSVFGKILLDVEQHGEAYYIYPLDGKKYYLGRPADAFAIMRELSLGITNSDMAGIPIAKSDITPLADTSYQPLDIPFAAQAPFGEWSDPRQQDGCEESSVLMAIYWALGKSLTPAEAKEKIIAISDWEEKNYGNFHDTSAADTYERIVKGYFNYDQAELKNNITLDDIFHELAKGNALVIPFNGQLLHNPYFTPPGPERHMLVIRGYDGDTHEFIVNDPGTRHGENFRYDINTFFNAIQDYPTGHHLPIEKVDKHMIVIKK
ncbi:MAG: C39 family peptidase [bacterium]|nr:C39 family peptidase [bacterium]